MIKKIMLCVLCFILAFSICVFAEDASAGSGTGNSYMQESAPAYEQGGRMRGQRPQDDMGNPQMGENGQDGAMQPPQVPPDSGDAANNAQEGADNSQGGENENAQPSFGGNIGGRPQDGATVPEGMNGDAQDPAGTATEGESIGNVGNLIQEYSTPIISLILLALAFVFVIFYKRKSY